MIFSIYSKNKIYILNKLIYLLKKNKIIVIYKELFNIYYNCKYMLILYFQSMHVLQKICFKNL